MVITKSEPFTKEEIKKLKEQLSSMALDLKRVALGYNRGSTGMAERFLTEALCRKKEIDLSVVKPYIAKLLKQVSSLQSEKNNSDKAEDALLYSILLQNASLQP